ncbi:MAG: fatty acid desaturase [Maribacter sp.]|jgi:fatty acid desaturase|tara:strand:+ start:255 stop:713 length:459 start_codon:yes stop_codon:yes gene_type:complete
MDIKTYLKTLKLLHLSLVAGLSIFMVVAIIQGDGFNTDLSTNSTFLYIVPVASLIGYFGSQVLFKKMLSSISQSDLFNQKLQRFQSALLVKYALIEAPAFLSLFAYYATGNALPLVIAGCLLAYLFVQGPTKEKLKSSLPLNAEEKRTLDFK